MVRMRSVPVSHDRALWDQFFAVFPLVIIGSKEADGTFDLAPKHMAIPIGWENHYGFVCTPRHATYRNIEREGQFTVSYPRPTQVVTSSLAASPRCDAGTKPTLRALPTRPAGSVDGVLVEDCYLHLECTRHRVIDGFGDESLIIGLVVAAWVDEAFLRVTERDEGEQLFHHPLLAYINPGRYAEIRQTAQFPFPRGFSR
jgi:flavin reductase (DIM6/NTAB) family NADH-FMN oxidoreductase RutF